MGCQGTSLDASRIPLSQQHNGNLSQSEPLTSSLERGIVGWGGGRCYGHSLFSVGCFPQLVRSDFGREVVVLHDILEVKVRHHLKLGERGIKLKKPLTSDQPRGDAARLDDVISQRTVCY